MLLRPGLTQPITIPGRTRRNRRGSGTRYHQRRIAQPGRTKRTGRRTLYQVVYLPVRLDIKLSTVLGIEGDAAYRVRTTPARLRMGLPSTRSRHVRSRNSRSGLCLSGYRRTGRRSLASIFLPRVCRLVSRRGKSWSRVWMGRR
jgi:hypothetical protein